jgi:hypothetical protein
MEEWLRPVFVADRVPRSDLELVSKPRITVAGKAQADSKAQQPQ